MKDEQKRVEYLLSAVVDDLETYMNEGEHNLEYIEAVFDTACLALEEIKRLRGTA